MSSSVVLVNEFDEQIGLAEKLSAHQKGLLHRAFSVFILRKNNDVWEILLQQRSLQKYHCGGLWTNACCSHPFENESVESAASRRLEEELGFTVPLKKIAVFTYYAPLENGLIEHEIDHVLIGFYQDSSTIVCGENEVMAYRWINVNSLRDEVNASPQLYTPWLLEAFGFVEKYIHSK